MDGLPIVLSVLGSLVVGLLFLQIKKQNTLEHLLTALTKMLNDYILQSSKEYMLKMDCRNTRSDCVLIDKVDQILGNRSEEWTAQKAINDDLWDSLNKHSHTGLPDGAKVVR